MKKQKKLILTIYKIINVAVVAILLFLLGVNLYTAAGRYLFKNDLPKVFGMANAIVVTGSMRDAIDPGDMVIIKEEEEYKVGDIITFR
jgi:signal peptidase I